MKREDMELFDETINFDSGVAERKRKTPKKHRPTKDELLDAYDEVEKHDKGRYLGDL